MNHRIETLTEKKLIGKRMRMSVSGNKTGDLWRSFMPRRKEILSNNGEKYKNEDPDSEEEIWIPIKTKGKICQKRSK
jgi:predicted transcriptional regulator YdeE